jgi:hypothetical protein
MNRRIWVGLLGVAGVVAAILLVRPPRTTPEPTPEPVAQLPAQPPAVDIFPEPEPPFPPTVDPPVPFVAGAGPHIIESGRTIGIDSSDLPQGADLLLDLRLPADVIPNEPALRVVAPDGRLLETVAKRGEDPDSLVLPLSPEWLRPGRYIIEIKVRERSHFPLRRFALEVR